MRLPQPIDRFSLVVSLVAHASLLGAVVHASARTIPLQPDAGGRDFDVLWIALVEEPSPAADAWPSNPAPPADTLALQKSENLAFLSTLHDRVAATEPQARVVAAASLDGRAERLRNPWPEATKATEVAAATESTEVVAATEATEVAAATEATEVAEAAEDSDRSGARGGDVSVVQSVGPMDWPGPGEVDSVASPRWPIRPSYPKRARLEGEESVVVVGAWIDATGGVAFSTVEESGGSDFDESAQRAVQQSVFRPARIAGHVVASQLALRIHFRLYD